MDPRTAILEISVTGAWDRRLWRRSHDALRESLPQHPAGLLFDLSGLDDPAAGSAPLWLTAESQAAQLDPPVPVAACIPAVSTLAVKLKRLGVRSRLVLCADVPQARAALASRRPLTDQIHLRLHPEPVAPAAAREVVAAACREWAMEPLLPSARLVVSELVANAVEHAGTRIDFVVTRLGPLRRGAAHGASQLRVAVYDGDPRQPHLTSHGLPSGCGSGERGYGLRIVDAFVRAWGTLPTPTGKVVWAVLCGETGSPARPARFPPA
ncbi:hypothetical protein GCM10010109_18210 [Actinoplanes campanulatus]|nr:hypothetical protein GCM10010109_18210 [Actinoplanes campanulatus]GID36339.1 hypothetical protein Aca09nite_28450 [Actinoplanes campanulatus]